LVDALLVQYYPYIKDIKEKRGADGVCPRLAVFEACEMLQQIGSSVINLIPGPDLTWYQVAWILRGAYRGATTFGVAFNLYSH
jgi:hypothetical protein